MSDLNFTPEATSIAEVHRRICYDAATIANQDERLIGLIPGIEGAIFREATSLSNRGGLAIAFMEGLEYADPEVVMMLRQIGREAVRRAILQNKELFAGLIVGEARKGQNYFDQFENDASVLHEEAF